MVDTVKARFQLILGSIIIRMVLVYIILTLYTLSSAAWQSIIVHVGLGSHLIAVIVLILDWVAITFPLFVKYYTDWKS